MKLNLELYKKFKTYTNPLQTHRFMRNNTSNTHAAYTREKTTKTYA
jgi:hypothetical protein